MPLGTVSYGTAAAVFLLLLGVKFVVIFALARAFGNEKPAALRSALALAPAGEFGFVLLALAQRAKALDEHTLQVVLAAALLSMLTTPFILARMERIVLHFIESEWTQRAVALHSLAVKAMSTRGHVIVCGYGRSGQALAQFLERVSSLIEDLLGNDSRISDSGNATADGVSE